MHKPLTVALVTAFLIASSVGTTIAAPRGEASIKAEIDAYIVTNPLDFEGIDALVYRYRGQHIQVDTVGIDRHLSAAEAADLVDAAADNETLSANGSMTINSIPTPQLYQTWVPISGGVQVWGTWDFPDWWAGQAAPVDIAGTTISVHTCGQLLNQAIWTYKTGGGQTYLGSLRSMSPNSYVLWNVSDYTTNFTSQADRGTTRIEVKRGIGCPPGPIQVGAAFDYEANQGGSVTSVSISFGFFSVSYSPPSLSGHWGTEAQYTSI